MVFFDLHPGAPASPRRLLFVGEAVSLAHVTRPLVLARGLDRERYDVHFATDRRFAALVESEGIEVHELPSIAPEEFFSRIAAGRPAYDEETLRGYVRDELRLLARLSPDLVVGDFRLSLPVSCELAGVPFANLCNAYWSPHSAFAFPVPDVPQTRLFGNFISRLAMPFLLARHAAVHNRLRRSFGLAPVASLFDAYTRGDWTLYADLPEVAPTRALPGNHRYLGPVLWEGLGELPAGARRKSSGPRAYVTAGSSGGGRMQTLAEAGARLAGCEVISARPGKMLPGIQAAAVSDVVACHGGSGTIYQALSQGVPVVGLVTNPDQMLVMRGVEAAGAGLGLLARTATATSVAGAVRRMLAEPGFRESARILARRIEACDAPAAFASFADKALDRKRPGPEAPAGEPAFDRSLAGRMNR
jgi:UDP:flavonoid glycosyltransferase YjiC (YdhE family)